MMDMVYPHAFNVVSGNRDLIDELALIHREDRDFGVREISGYTPIPNVVEVVCSIVIGCVGGIALPGCGAIDELDTIDSVKVISREKNQSRIPAVSNEQFVFLRSEGYGMGRFESTYALEVNTRLQVEHLDGVVYLGRDEEVIPSKINCEVIEVTRNFRKVRSAQKCDGL
ncbi:hypothetical protein [Tunturibacter empetritectus]|uniref:Uncharacterized protein n=1 Tax=Tunturiibacter lichenicola TaxID=2051959 RepID=A0A7W8J603_9BACT|nr:hypothetical protein [Edaphobacter lichenicola]MBB5343290.1 hypothetical protein [Edaphobacter lichenicola]